MTNGIRTDIKLYEHILGNSIEENKGWFDRNKNGLINNVNS